MTQVTDVSRTELGLADRVEALLADASSQRVLVALAGVPGSGKSTVSRALLVELAARGISDVAIIPMVYPIHFDGDAGGLTRVKDGFHYSQAALSAFPDPELAFKRRGAPFTFDAVSFVDLVRAMRTMPMTATDQPERFLYAPSFDHALKDPVLNAIPVSSRNRLIILEGNYTLLDRKPWNEITGLCEEKWFVDADRELVKHRLAARHMVAGIEATMAAAEKRAEENDLPNGDLIRQLLIKPDLVIQN
jgi:pantothenate kinase